MAPNSPLGRKHNLGMAEAIKRGFDRLLIMGSDDLISNEGLEILLNADIGHVGFRKMYAVNTESNQSIYFEYEKDTRIIGAGRLLTREAIISASNRSKFVPTNKDGKRFFTGEYMISSVSASHLERRGHGIKKSSIVGLWENSLQRSLDNSSDIHLAMCGFPAYCIEEEKVHIIDLKNEKVQINHYSALTLQEPHRQYEANDWGWFLSKQELRAINALQKK
jgi:hypothetical protein